MGKIKIMITTSVVTEVELNEGETFEQFKTRDVDIYLHGAGEQGYLHKVDLGSSVTTMERVYTQAEIDKDESEEQTMFEVSPKLQDAIDKLTIEIFNDLGYGDEVELNDEYHVYHYSEDDIIVINRVKDENGQDDWTEVLQVMSNGLNLTFEEL